MGISARPKSACWRAGRPPKTGGMAVGEMERWHTFWHTRVFSGDSWLIKRLVKQ